MPAAPVLRQDQFRKQQFRFLRLNAPDAVVDIGQW